MGISQDDVRHLIANREDKNADFKLELDFALEKIRAGLAEDAVSFANAEGGVVIVGVEDKTRRVAGIQAPLDHDRIVQSITDLTDPPVEVSVDTLDVDGKLVGVIRFSRGRMVHRLRKDRTVYIRRDGINYKATPEEIVQLSDERDYASRVYFEGPEELYSAENGTFMLSGETQPYRKIAKGGGLYNLAECPVFSPEFSRWTSAPEFGGTKGSLLISYPTFVAVTHRDFVQQVRKAEEQVGILGRYLSLGAPAILYWSISSDGGLCYGCGSDTLLKALEDGELGVITVTTSGDFRGADEQRSFMFLICGYCKAREKGITYVQDREVRLYLSSIPVSNGWIRSLFSPFLDEDTLPFATLSYEQVHLRLRVWQSVAGPEPNVAIQGVIRRYRSRREYAPLIGGAISDTRWFDPRMYRLETEWRGGNTGRDRSWEDRVIEEIDDARAVQECPVELLEECVVSLTNPIAFYDDIESGKTSRFHLPLIKHLELEAIGHTVHVLGLNASPMSHR